MYEHEVAVRVEGYESAKASDTCPEGRHAHAFIFKLIFKAEEIPSDINSLSDSLITVFELPSNWTLYSLAETMYREIKEQFSYLEQVSVVRTDNLPHTVRYYE